MCPKFPSGRLTRLAFYCLLAVLLSPVHADGYPNTNIKKILVLFPAEGWSSVGYRMIYNGMKAVFDQSSRYDVIALGDTLDLSLASSEAEQRRIADIFRTKHVGEGFDVVVPVTPEPIEFVLRHRQVMFPGVPIVFCSYSAYELHRLERGSDVTGVAVTVDIAGTIDIARKLQPGLKNIAAVAGAGFLDRAVASHARETFKKDFQGQLEWIDLTELPMRELLERVSHLPESTAVLFLNIQRDGSGRKLVSAEAMQLLSRSANAPLYSIMAATMGYGTIGGCLTTSERYGRETARIILRVLSGEKAGSIEPVVMYDHPAIIDWRELKRWKLDEGLLPPGSIIRFKELSPWDEYRWWIIGTVAFICLLLLLISLLTSSLQKRKQAERKLARSETSLKKAQEVASTGSFGIDIRNRRVNWSAGANEIFGLPPDSALSYESLLQVIHPIDREIVKVKWGAALEGEPFDLEYRILAGEREKWIRATLQVEFDKYGKAVFATGIVQDINRRKMAEELTTGLRQQLAHVLRVYTVNEIGQNLAHEISQPLMAISTNVMAATSLLSLKNPDLEEVRAALDDVVKDSQRAQKVVERIRNLVRNNQPEYIDVDLNRVAGDTLEVVRADARAKGIALRLDLESDLPLVKGDPVQLQQVVLNLTINAFEAMDNDQADRRLLTVKTARGGDGTVSLSVSDTGRGVGHQATGRIFEPFFTTKPQGLGLGLAIGRTIAEAHGGTLDAVPNSDKGATFRLRLPVPAGGMRFVLQEA